MTGNGNGATRVRWKRKGRWRQGRLDDPVASPDGSLRVFDDYNGGARSLRPENVEVLQRGPRGGRRWVPYDDAGHVDQLATGSDVAPPADRARERLERLRLEPRSPDGGGIGFG